MISFRRHLFVCMTVAALSLGNQALAGAAAAPGAAAKSDPQAVPLSGKVLETMEAGGYTYLQLKTGADKVWVAIPQSKIAVGQELILLPGYEFKNFVSRGLNRKFDRIIFSAGIDGTKTIKLSPSAIKMVHGQMGAQNQGATAAKPAAPAAKGAARKPVPVVLERIQKAKGRNSYTVAQLYANRLKLEKKPVVVRGKVVKVSTRILKRNWIHLQDGTGSDKKKNNLIVVTSQDLPREGDIVTARGTLYNRIDFGSGYKYELLIQNARVK